MNFTNTNAHWFLRVGLASVFIYHGILKFSDLNGFAGFLPISYTEVVLVAAAELAGGLLVLLGGFGTSKWYDLFTRIGAVLNIPVMIGAVVMVHWGRWNFVPSETHPMGGFQFQAVLILLMLYLAAVGNRRDSFFGSPNIPAASI